MKKIPLIIDCDPGLDDAMCIMMLGADEKYDIRGITATHGNVPLENTAENALFLSHYYGIDCPVFRGAEQALLADHENAAFVHGKKGLGDYECAVDGLTYAEGHAWDFLYETAVKCGGELVIAAVGPLTNLAITVLKHRDFPGMVKRLVIMGGAATIGNTIPVAEFNFRKDPEVAEIVLQAGFPDVTVVDLDCCKKAYLNREEMGRLAELPETNRIHGLVRSMMEHKKISDAAIIERYGKEYAGNRAEKMVICDAVAAAVLRDPSLVQCRDVYMVVETEGTETSGQSIIDRLGLAQRTNVHLAAEIDRDRYGKLFMDSIRYYEEAEV